MRRVASVLGSALILLSACVERTEETEVVRKKNLERTNTEFYHKAFVDTVPNAYWRICEFAVREGFDFEKILEVSDLEFVDMNGWTNNKDAAQDMISEALSAIHCSIFEEVEPTSQFSELGGHSYICGDNRLHAYEQELEPGKVFVGIAVERGK